MDLSRNFLLVITALNYVGPFLFGVGLNEQTGICRS